MPKTSLTTLINEVFDSMLQSKNVFLLRGLHFTLVWQMVVLLSFITTISRSAEKHPASENFLVPSPQRTGRPQAGWKHLVYGNYLTSGIPLALLQQINGRENANHLKRTGESESVPFEYNLITSESGQPIVVANCLQCHAQEIDGQFILGVGNSFADFTRDLGPTVAAIDLLLAVRYGKDSAERNDYQRIKTSVTAVAPYIQTKVRGVHSADKLAFVLAAHRDAKNLQWHTPREVPTALEGKAIPTDVPPWWVLKKKHAMFYAGTGRGDFARIMMASSLITLQDAAEASEIDRRFVDILAFLKTIEPPRYSKPINAELADRGHLLFEANCTRCHGTYGEKEHYPNLLIATDEVGTDPLLAKANGTKYLSYFEGYAESWFAQPPHAAKLVVTDGYVAPPLDGIWITAPYLHNGSVPNLMTLLESSERPTAWRRSFRSDDYDYEKIGWRYETVAPPDSHDSTIYDTTQPGYGNQGHRFGDDFDTEERKAVVEYLKTL